LNPYSHALIHCALRQFSRDDERLPFLLLLPPTLLSVRFFVRQRIWEFARTAGVSQTAINAVFVTFDEGIGDFSSNGQ
jgi:hypothetical protein